MDILGTICDTAPPQAGFDGATWMDALDQALDAVLDTAVDLDSTNETTPRRTFDGTKTKRSQRERAILLL